MDDKMISVTDAAMLLDKSERQIRRWCNEGRLASNRDGRAFEISLESVLDVLRSSVSDAPEDGQDGEDLVAEEEEMAQLSQPIGQVMSQPTADMSASHPDSVLKAAQSLRTALKSASEQAEMLISEVSQGTSAQRLLQSRLEEILREIPAVTIPKPPANGNRKPRRRQKLGWILVALVAFLLVLAGITVGFVAFSPVLVSGG